MSNMYPEIIMEYYRHPRFKGTLLKADFEAKDLNPLCGDMIKVTGTVADGVITQLKHDGHGCAISQASAELLSEHLEGKPLAEVKQLKKEDLLKMLGIPISPVRLKCALLSLKVIKMAAYAKLGEQLDDE